MPKDFRSPVYHTAIWRIRNLASISDSAMAKIHHQVTGPFRRQFNRELVIRPIQSAMYFSIEDNE